MFSKVDVWQHYKISHTTSSWLSLSHKIPYNHTNLFKIVKQATPWLGLYPCSRLLPSAATCCELELTHHGMYIYTYVLFIMVTRLYFLACVYEGMDYVCMYEIKWLTLREVSVRFNMFIPRHFIPHLYVVLVLWLWLNDYLFTEN